MKSKNKDEQRDDRQSSEPVELGNTVNPLEFHSRGETMRNEKIQISHSSSSGHLASLG